MMKRKEGRGKTYLVSMSEPGRSLFLIRDQGDPLVAATTQALPYIGISAHPSRLARRIKWKTGGSADTVSEAFVVPVGRVLQYEPSTRLADTAEAFSLVAMPSNEARGVKVTVEAEFLLAGGEVGVGGSEVGSIRRDRRLGKGAKEVGLGGKVGVRIGTFGGRGDLIGSKVVIVRGR